MSVSIVVNYYNNRKGLHSVVESFENLSKTKKDFFELILVDDHSHEPVDLGMFNGISALRVFRLTDDIPWNQAGARNIGALEARKRQIFFCDVDHVLEPEELSAFVDDSAELQVGTRLTPNRKRACGRIVEGERLKPSINIFLIHRQDFFRAGGYEEMYSGHYGQEDKYFRYCCRWNGIRDAASSFKISILGGSTRGLDRDTKRNETMLEALVSLNASKPRKAFHFQYEQIW